MKKISILLLSALLLLCLVACGGKDNESNLPGDTGAEDQTGGETTLETEKESEKNINFTGRFDLELPSIFASNMVLQRGKPAPIWGWNGTPGEEISATLGSYTAQCVVDDNGEFYMELPAMEAAYDQKLVLKKEGGGQKTYLHVNVGEVWYCSGQSNMQLSVNKTHDVEALRAKADDLGLRCFKVEISAKYELQKDVSGSWKKVTSSNVGERSAIAYITAALLQEELGVPVAFIECHNGGSGASPWLDYDMIFSAERLSVYDNHQWIPTGPMFGGGEGRTVWEDHEFYWQVGTENEGVLRNGLHANSIGNRFAPTGLYNGMQGPLANYAVAGVMWYQGESSSNAQKYPQYNYILYDLIQQWRRDFRDEDLPVMIVQLAPYSTDAPWAEMRQVQLDTAKRLDHVEVIATAYEGALKDENGKCIDLDYYTNSNGQPVANAIHPGTKVPVATRMFNTIMNTVYGADYEYCGPEYEYMEVKGSQAILHFSHLGDGLQIREGDSKLTGFKISADGKKFVNAEATIAGDTVVVSAASVANPVAVRYAFVNVVTRRGTTDTLGGNLENSIGEPAFPFEATLSDVSIYKITAGYGKLSAEIRELGHTTSSYRVELKVQKAGSTLLDNTYTAEFATAGNYVIHEALPKDADTVTVRLYDGTTLLAEKVHNITK